MTRKIYFIGLSLGGNKGGPAIYASLVSLLREYLVDFSPVLASTQIENDRKYKALYDVDDMVALPSWSLSHPWRFPVDLNRLYRFFEDADAVVDMTGVKFIGGRGLVSAKTQIRSAANILIPVQLGRPTVVFTQTYGPFGDGFTRMLAKIALRRANLIFARDPGSMKELATIGLASRVTQYPDVAFCLPTAELAGISLAPDLRALVMGDAPFVGISPSNKVVLEETATGRSPKYVQLMRDFILRLLDQGQRVVIIPHSNHPNPAADDTGLARQLYHAVGGNAKQIQLVDEDLMPQQLKAIIARSAYFVGSRYHSLIAALSSGVPAITVGWSHKYDGLFDLFGLQEYCYNLETADLATLTDAATTLERQLPEISERIQQRIPVIQQLVHESVRRVAQSIDLAAPTRATNK